jgi:hypothetical protein
MNHPSNDDQAIARELAALGEAPPTDDELRFVRGAEAQPEWDVRNVTALFGVAHPPMDRSGSARGELLEIDQRRVWKVVADRGAAFLEHPPEHHEARDSGAWRVVIGAVAVAAGVLLVPRLAPPSDLPSEADLAAQRETLELTGASARAAVDALPGPVGGERASAMASDYAQRLATQRSGGQR